MLDKAEVGMTQVFVPFPPTTIPAWIVVHQKATLDSKTSFRKIVAYYSRQCREGNDTAGGNLA